MKKQEVKERLQREGYGSVRELKDAPNESFPEHTHKGDHIMVVIEGSVSIKVEGKNLDLKAGEEFRCPAGVPHSATMGPEGCEYIVGEKNGPTE